MDKDILIQKYLHAELSERERQTFNTLMSTDEDFATEVEFRTVAYADRSSDLKLELGKIDKEKLHRSDPEVMKRVHKTFPFFRKIAAVLLVGLLLYGLYEFYNTRTSPAPLVDIYLGQKHPPPSVLMDDSVIPKAWSLALVAYRNEKYTLAIDQLETLLQHKPDQQEYLLYLALSYLYKEPPSYGTAIEYLEAVNQSDNPAFKDEGLWYLSLAHYKNSNREKAAELLQIIIEQRSWKHEEAIKLLNY